MAEPLPIGLVAHWVYCPRRAWLEASGEQVDSFQIEQGLHRHARVDDPRRSRSREATSVDLLAPELGISGRCDVVQQGESGVRIVEYKSTPVRRTATVTPSNRIQVVLQALALEEMGYAVAGAEVYFTDHATSIPVLLDGVARREAKDALARTAEVVSGRNAPPPRDDEANCRFCSHVSVCLPDEERGLGRLQATDPEGQTVHVTKK